MKLMRLSRSLGGLLCAAVAAACAEGTSPKPVPVGVWTDLTAGGDHTCGLTGDGAAHCWGLDTLGQLGDGPRIRSSTPVAVAGGLTFASLTAGYGHSCGLTSSGVAYCWGYNYSGELGDGSTTNRPTPVPVVGLTFASLTAGSGHTCGLTSGGAAYCWGDNHYGELGDGSTDSSAFYLRPAPVAVVGGLMFVSLTAGSWHTCGVTTNGAAYCWGLNAAGDLGDGSTDSSALYVRPAPVAVAGGLTFASLTAGLQHTCGVAANGAAYCWGDNYYGGLGDGSRDSAASYRRLTPVAVVGGLTFASLAAGRWYTCGLTSGGTAYCWGSDESGQLGDGSSGFMNLGVRPSAVAGGLTFARLTASGSHVCGVTSGGAAFCWGDNSDGELGDGSTTTRLTPVGVANP
jgi:alpha-tubulin suppressor-like RCC1 family protein